MVAKPFSTETRSFRTKDEANSFFSEMLNRYRPGDRVKDADKLDLAALLKLHTDYPSKVGSGIDHFCVMPNRYGTKSFGIVRSDGTRDDFSYKHCITPRKIDMGPVEARISVPTSNRQQGGGNTKD